MLTKSIVSLFLSFSLSSVALGAGFDLVENKAVNEVCKVVNKIQDECLPRASYYKLKDEKAQQIPDIDVLGSAKRVTALQKEQSKEEPGIDQMRGGLFSAYLLGQDKLDYVIANYRELSIRKIAIPDISGEEIPEKYVDRENKKIYIPFFFSLRWKGHWMTEGTLNVEAVLELDLVTEEDAQNEEGGSDIATVFSSPKVRNFSDSSTESQKEVLRKLEAAARAIHFKSVKGDGTIDEKTRYLLEQVAAPMVTQEAFAVPIYQEIYGALGAILNEIISEFFKPEGQDI